VTDKSKDSQLIVRINSDLHEWFRVYTQGINNTMSGVITAYIESLRQPEAKQDMTDSGAYKQDLDAHSKVQQLTAVSEERAEQIHYLREQLVEKDRQIETLTRSLDHAQQLHGLAQKNIATLAEQLDTSKRMIEDMRTPFWKRLFRLRNHSM